MKIDATELSPIPLIQQPNKRNLIPQKMEAEDFPMPGPRGELVLDQYQEQNTQHEEDSVSKLAPTGISMVCSLA